ncbi:hypothetical protein HPB50_021022 [Hyalomma asiaticum]|uniref:Uncharacterized protein n=1 Tax=Hyalomma asiaticum TaxID=266040 RepID=A0ACB7SQ18_HYAAI|nr:hypothetical protein HPB50_021022 [Hyalomma asiaticum]
MREGWGSARARDVGTKRNRKREFASFISAYSTMTRDFAPSTTASDGSTPPFACSTTKSTRSAHAGIRRNAPDDPGTSLVTTKVPAHKLRKPVWTLLRAKYQRLKAQKNRSPGEDAPSVRPKLGQRKHLRRPVTGAGTRGADGGSSSQVLMMSSAFEMDTAPPLNVTQTGPPLLSQTPEASQAPATTPLPSDAQINSQQMNQRSNPPKQQNARPQQRLAKCSTIVVKFDGYIDITRLNFSAVCQGILYAVQATPTEKEDNYIKRREKQNLIVVQTYRATIAHRLMNSTSIIVGSKTYQIRCYNAFDETYSRGVIHGIYPDITEETLRSELTIQGRTIANVRRLGTTNTVLVIVEGEELPRHARLFSGVYNIYPERRKTAQCASCQELGHRADVCPNRRTYVRCPHCSKQLPPGQETSDPTHECEQYCFLCDDHNHSPSSPNCPRKTVNTPRRNQTANDTAKNAVARYSQPSQNPEDWPPLPRPTLPISNRFAPLQDASPTRAPSGDRSRGRSRSRSRGPPQHQTPSYGSPRLPYPVNAQPNALPGNQKKTQNAKSLPWEHSGIPQGPTNPSSGPVSASITKVRWEERNRESSTQQAILPPLATPESTTRHQHPGVRLHPRDGQKFTFRQWTEQSAIESEGLA